MSAAGARRRSDITPEHLDALNQGRVASSTLAEALAIDHLVLLRHVLPDASDDVLAAVERAQQLGILKRMQRIGVALRDLDAEQRARLATHPSDTVRGWICFALSDAAGLDVAGTLEAIRPFADDDHFAVREWAWMAARPVLVADLDASIGMLAGWARDESAHVRRFASEALRPRGVWSTHIAELKRDPDRALPILQNLRTDPSRYVQDSVANWINDAAKSDPDWARALSARWRASSPTAATERIITRGLRSLPADQKL